jgi:LacI family transcriptional regulator
VAESPPTIYDVASEAGVSIATVSRVLNGYSQTRAATRDRVLAAVRELGFVPNGAARGLSRGSKRILGLVFAHTPADDDLLAEEEGSLLFTDSIVRGAEESAERHGYSLLLSGAGGEHGDHAASVNALTGKTDGLILLDRVLPERRLSAIGKRFPIVLLAGSGRCRSAVTVRVDNEGGMRAVAEHLVAVHALRRMAFVSGFADSPDSASRGAALCLAVTELGGELRPADHLTADWTSSGAARVVQQRLASGGEVPEAIVCANDQMAVGVIHVLAANGLHVPDDVAVVGFDDVPLARHLSPPLTTVRQPTRQLGVVAVESLVALLEGIAPTRRDIVLPTELIVRGSCGCVADGDARGSAGSAAAAVVGSR